MNKYEKIKYLRENVYPELAKIYQESDISIAALSKKYNVSYSSFYNYMNENNLVVVKDTRSLRCSEDIIKQIISDFEKDPYISLATLSEKYNMAQRTISRILKRNGFEPHNIKVQKETKEKIALGAQIYTTTNLSIIDSAKKAQIGKNTLAKYLKANNLLKKEVHIQKNITFDCDFFETIDTEEKAYWFGFIYADGCIHNNSQLTVEISKKDEDMLDIFKESIKSNIGVKYRSRTNKSGSVTEMCSVTLSSRKLCSDLSKKGCVQNKTYDGKIKIEFSDLNLKSAFLRGYIDGDGYISKLEHKTHIIKIVVKNHNVANYLFKSIMELTNFSVIPLFKYEYDSIGGAYRISIQNKKDFFTFLDLIYENSHIHMNRKYERYLEQKQAVLIRDSQEN